MEEESKDKSTMIIISNKENNRMESSDNSVLDILNNTPDRYRISKRNSENAENDQNLNQNSKNNKSNQWNGDTSEIKESLNEGKEEQLPKNKNTNIGSKSSGTQKVYPINHQEDLNSQNKIKIRKHFITLNKEELEKEGISGIRNSIANLIKYKAFGIITVILTAIYSLYIFSILAAEQNIYDSKAGAIAVEIVELFFMGLFTFEIALYLSSFGPKLYFRDLLNLMDIILILLTIIWYIMDLADSDKFRVKAAFRVIRVALMICRLRFAFVMGSARKFLTKSVYNTQSSMGQALSILQKFRDNLNDIQLASDINYCIDVVTSGFICKNCSKSKDTMILESDSSKEKNQSQNKNYEEIKRSIQNSVDKFNFSNEFHLSSDAEAMLEDVNQFEFNIFDLHNETNGNEMITLSTYLIYKHNLFVELTIELNTFGMFIKNIQEGYNDVAYHNKIHGMDVGRLAYYYATTGGIMSKAKCTNQDLFCFIVGGAIHDFEHLGWNNAYLIETQHEWAITYNDISVCENHHVAAAFEVIKTKQGCNIFEHTSHENFRSIRKKITQMVIATDMAYHFEHLDKLKKMIENNNTDFTEEKNKVFLMCMTLHLSDLTNPTKTWFESYKWACLVNEEFFVQGDVEKQLGLNGSKFNDRNFVNIAEAQTGFINLFIQPTFDCFSLLLPKLKRNCDHLSYNSEKWKSMVDECRKLKEDGNDLIKLFHIIDENIAEMKVSKKDRDFKKNSRRNRTLNSI